jgi:hypothetical protein
MLAIIFISVLKTEDNRHFHLTCQRVLCCIVCNVFVNHVCLHAVFLYVICVGFKSSSAFMLYVVSCTDFK